VILANKTPGIVPSSQGLSRVAVAGLKLVELRCEDEIAFGEAVDLVRPGGDLRLAPAQQNIWVMALRFRYLAYFIHESERTFEIGKRKHLRNVVFVDDLPSGHLLRQVLQFFTFQRRNAAAARDTGLSGKVGQSSSLRWQMSSLFRLTL
jgi:hypothetical protein